MHQKKPLIIKIYQKDFKDWFQRYFYPLISTHIPNTKHIVTFFHLILIIMFQAEVACKNKRNTLQASYSPALPFQGAEQEY